MAASVGCLPATEIRPKTFITLSKAVLTKLGARSASLMGIFAIGSCAYGDGMWLKSYRSCERSKKSFPWITTFCRPRPETIIHGVALALDLIDKKVCPVELKQVEFPIPRYHPDDQRHDDELAVYQSSSEFERGISCQHRGYHERPPPASIRRVTRVTDPRLTTLQN